MLADLLLLALGLAVLLGGGDLLVRGASALARVVGISPLAVGLTVVAFGTSAPELSVNLLAAYRGTSEISFGNVVGSNIANISLVIGLAALVRPLRVEGQVIRREIPMMILASLVVLAVGSDLFLTGAPSVIDRADGMVLLLLFCVFLFYTLGDVLRRRDDSLLRQAEEDRGRPGLRGGAINVALAAAGFVLLVAGARLAVDSAVSVAGKLGAPPVLVGLTVVAVGTSLPEIFTSVVAAAKGHSDIAIGNVVGSNIFNLLLIAGAGSAWRPIPVPASGGSADLLVMTFLSVLLLPLCLTDRGRVVRAEGAVLIVLYVAYLAWRIVGAGSG